MDGTQAHPDPRWEEIARRLERLERRVAALETARPRRPGGEDGSLAAASAAAAVAESTQEPRAELLPLIGRTFLVLAGAFLLRATTEAGLLARTVGTALGLAYAITWIVAADRAAVAARRSSALFHGIAASLIAFPLLWEATVQFGFIPYRASVIALAVVTAPALYVAWHRRLQPMAWVVTLGAVGTAIALAVATKMLVLLGVFLLLLGLATLWIAYVADWMALGWLVACVADGFVVLLTAIVLIAPIERAGEMVRPGSLVVLQLALMLIYFASFAWRTLSADRELLVGETVQGIVALAVGLGGAVAVTQATGTLQLPVGAVSLLLAAVCYAAAFAVADRAAGSRYNFIAFSSVALVFTIVGIDELVSSSLQGLALAGAAVVTAWLGWRRERATLSLHAALYVLAAAIQSDLLVTGVQTLVGPGAEMTGWAAVPMLVVLIAAAVVTALPVATHGRTWGRFSRAPKAIVLTILALGIAGLAVTLLGRLVPGARGAAADAGILAAVRTGVLAALAVALAWVGRGRALPEARWLVYPVLGAGAVKLVLEDVPNGRASTLFVALALYGGALILAPRLARTRH